MNQTEAKKWYGDLTLYIRQCEAKVWSWRAVNTDEGKVRVVWWKKELAKAQRQLHGAVSKAKSVKKSVLKKVERER